jgi:branched-chain amino acid transport system permease protein
MKGVVVGALIISLLPELLRDLAEYRYLMFGVLLVVVMVFRPQGLWPTRASEAERTQARLEKASIKNGMAR